MSEEKRKPSGRVELSYCGVSSVHMDEGGAQRVLLTTPEGSTARADVGLEDVILFREALATFYSIVHRSYHYRASSPDTNVRYNEWRPALKEATPGEARQLFYKFLAEEDPDAQSILDPVVSVHPDGITFEAFSEDGRQYAALDLQSSGYEGEAVCGTNTFDMSSDLYRTLQQLRGDVGAGRLVIGADAESLPEPFRARIDKSLAIDNGWLRSALQLQATLTLPGRRFDLSRMDLYSVLRHLRLNRTRKGDRKAVRFTLVPGAPTEVALEPWGWRHSCSAGVYEGSRSEVIRIWDREDLLSFDRLLPWIERIEVHSCGEALPTFWMVRCGDVTLTMGSSGFRRRNWPRGVLLDIDLPRHGRGPQAAGDVLGALPDSGERLAAAAIAQEVGLDTAEVRDALRRLVQDGEVVYDVAQSGYRKRPLALVSGRLPELTFRDEREARAHELVEAKVVSLSTRWLHSGEVEVSGSVRDDAHHNAIYEPFFAIRPEGQLRRPRCSCSFILNPENRGLPCDHIVALWIQYQLSQRALDPGQLEVDHSTLVKRRPRGDEVHEVSLRHSRVEESFTVEGQTRRSTLLFDTVDDARDAYLKRVKHLKNYGYLDASGS